MRWVQNVPFIKRSGKQGSEVFCTTAEFVDSDLSILTRIKMAKNKVFAITGPRGSKGVQGDHGPPGTGSPGSHGPYGVPGANGPPGPVGQIGLKGSRGTAGDTGKKGEGFRTFYYFPMTH